MTDAAAPARSAAAAKKRLRLLIVALLLFTGLPLLLLGILSLRSDGEETRCADVRNPTPARFQAGDFEARARIVGELQFCGRFTGRDQAQVEALLGAPTEVRAGELRYAFPADDGSRGTTFVIFFDDDGRVEDTRYDVYTGF